MSGPACRMKPYDSQDYEICIELTRDMLQELNAQFHTLADGDDVIELYIMHNLLISKRSCDEQRVVIGMSSLPKQFVHLR